MNDPIWDEKSLRKIYTLAYRLTGDGQAAAALAEEVCVRLGRRGVNPDSLNALPLRTFQEASSLYLRRYRHLPAANPAPADGAPAGQQALNALPPEERVAVILRDMFRLPLKELETILAWPRHEVGAALARGRRNLCRHLGNGNEVSRIGVNPNKMNG
ncbi:sigma factor-like helix-turn-helix DNA-binding protein [Moorella sp. Hama-1]|uniref:sigma factor-like helix-turn-helix DNA-binding protein n=1 Tax=Moorella sp. Hama-1 TaxID=2138101 RepID=UPI000D642655|nr:sigma factor-like helix-turn-helix DNA-binding protein [Moorella sp. Hama-1]BCV22631.1 hypothetical protein hamaS1_27000 [Moorella sp. Hama-1]